MIDQIVAKEWELFDKVNNLGGRAACQNDWKTFYAMRASVLCFLREQTLRCYYEDLTVAEQEGRNLLAEKYAYMMEQTEPVYFRERLEPFLTVVSAERRCLIDRITELLVEDERRFREKHSGIGERGRPLADPGGWTSFKEYLIGELKTYSKKTLQAYLADVLKLQEQGKSPSRLIHDRMAQFYGFNGAEDLERQLERPDAEDETLSF